MSSRKQGRPPWTRRTLHSGKSCTRKFKKKDRVISWTSIPCHVRAIESNLKILEKIAKIDYSAMASWDDLPAEVLRKVMCQRMKLMIDEKHKVELNKLHASYKYINDDEWPIYSDEYRSESAWLDAIVHEFYENQYIFWLGHEHDAEEGWDY